MKVRIKKVVQEISAVGAPGVGGSIEGHVDQRPRKKKKIDEMFSTSTQNGRIKN